MAWIGLGILHYSIENGWNVPCLCANEMYSFIWIKLIPFHIIWFDVLWPLMSTKKEVLISPHLKFAHPRWFHLNVTILNVTEIGNLKQTTNSDTNKLPSRNERNTKLVMKMTNERRKKKQEKEPNDETAQNISHWKLEYFF